MKKVAHTIDEPKKIKEPEEPIALAPEIEAGANILSLRIIPFMEHMERSIPNSTLDKLAEYSMEEVCGTAISSGIVLKPEEWQRIMLIKQGEDADKYSGYQLPYPEEEGNIDNFMVPENYNHGVMNLLKPHFGARTIFAPVWAERLGGFTKIAATVPGYMRNHRTTHSTADVLLPIGAGYLGYRALFGKAAKSPNFLSKLLLLIKRNPALAVLLIGAGGSAAAGVLNTAEGFSYPDYPRGLRKHSSVKNLHAAWLPILAGLGGAHLWAANTKSKARRGVSSNAFASLVSEHPNIAGLLAALGLWKMGLRGSMLKSSSENGLSAENKDLCLHKLAKVNRMEKLVESLQADLYSNPPRLLDTELFYGTAGLLKVI